MTFNIYADTLRTLSTVKRTENGATAYSTTGSAIVDLFSVIGAMRNGDSSMERVTGLVDAAYAEDPLLTMRMLFYARDIRGGLGEREVFRKAIYHCAKEHPDTVRMNLTLIPEYGRWDDLFSLIGTPVEENMWSFIKLQLEEDQEKLAKGESVSLLAKWMPSAKTSSKDTMALARYACGKLGVSVYDYKRLIRDLRRAIHLLEQDMTAKRWKEVDYEHIPSQAHMRHTAAFYRNDSERYREYLGAVSKGKAEVKTQTLFPYEIVERLNVSRYGKEFDGDNEAMEAMWRNLPDYVGEGGDILVIADTSGSMTGRPMATSTSLAIYFAERNSGMFKDLYLTFSERPQPIKLDRNASLTDKYRQMLKGPWGCNTNLAIVFDMLLYVAKQTGARQEDLPRSLVVITDMEIDSCSDIRGTLWDTVVDTKRREFTEAGYDLPNIVFWNVASRHDTFLANKSYKGVQMVSGSSASVFRAVLGFINGMTPLDAVRQVLSNERYSAVKV